MNVDNLPLRQLQQGMRVIDQNGQAVGYLREVRGRSVLVSELFGRREFWIADELIAEAAMREVRLRAAVRVPPTTRMNRDSVR